MHNSSVSISEHSKCISYFIECMNKVSLLWVFAANCNFSVGDAEKKYVSFFGETHSTKVSREEFYMLCAWKQKGIKQQRPVRLRTWIIPPHTLLRQSLLNVVANMCQVKTKRKPMSMIKQPDRIPFSESCVVAPFYLMFFNVLLL